MELVARDDGHAEAGRGAGVAAGAVERRDAVLKGVDVRLNDLVPFLREDLQRDAFVPVVEIRDGPRAEELEEDGVAGFVEPEEESEDGQEDTVEDENLRPDLFAGLVRDVEGDEVRSAGRGASPQRDDDAEQAVDRTALLAVVFLT